MMGRNKKEVLLQNSSIIGELDQLKNILEEKKYYTLLWDFYDSHFSLDSIPNDALIKFGRDFIEKNKAGCSPEFKKVFLKILRETRIPYRNSSHIYEGIEYYTNLSNYFVETDFPF